MIKPAGSKEQSVTSDIIPQNNFFKYNVEILCSTVFINWHRIDFINELSIALV